MIVPRGLDCVSGFGFVIVIEKVVSGCPNETRRIYRWPDSIKIHELLSLAMLSTGNRLLLRTSRHPKEHACPNQP